MIVSFWRCDYQNDSCVEEMSSSDYSICFPDVETSSISSWSCWNVISNCLVPSMSSNSRYPFLWVLIVFIRQVKCGFHWSNVYVSLSFCNLIDAYWSIQLVFCFVSQETAHLVVGKPACSSDSLTMLHSMQTNWCIWYLISEFKISEIASDVCC